MFISERLVRKYQKTHERKFGESITAKEAERNLSNLAELIRLAKKERRNHHGN